MSFYQRLNQEKSYHQAFFLAVSLGMAGLCSLYPVACFKKYSGKERAKLNREVEDLEETQKEDDRGRRDEPPRRVRHRTHSPRRVAHRPSHDQRRRHSTARHRRHGRGYESRDRRDRGRRESEVDEVEEVEWRPKHREHRPRYDEQLDRERSYRHHGHAPPRRYHHNS